MNCKMMIHNLTVITKPTQEWKRKYKLTSEQLQIIKKKTPSQMWTLIACSSVKKRVLVWVANQQGRQMLLRLLVYNAISMREYLLGYARSALIFDMDLSRLWLLMRNSIIRNIRVKWNKKQIQTVLLRSNNTMSNITPAKTAQGTS